MQLIELDNSIQAQHSSICLTWLSTSSQAKFTSLLTVNLEFNLYKIFKFNVQYLHGLSSSSNIYYHGTYQLYYLLLLLLLFTRSMYVYLEHTANLRMNVSFILDGVM